MFSKKENKEIRILFFTSFGKYMSQKVSYNGTKIKWLNYPTNIKDIHFRLHCDKKNASVYIDFQHKDDRIRRLFFEQFEEFKIVFTEYAGGFWRWEKDYKNEIGTDYSRIISQLDNISIYEQSSWPTIFEFYRFNLLNLDKFWVDYNEIFKKLKS